MYVCIFFRLSFLSVSKVPFIYFSLFFFIVLTLTILQQEQFTHSHYSEMITWLCRRRTNLLAATRASLLLSHWTLIHRRIGCVKIWLTGTQKENNLERKSLKVKRMFTAEETAPTLVDREVLREGDQNQIINIMWKQHHIGGGGYFLDYFTTRQLSDLQSAAVSNCSLLAIWWLSVIASECAKTYKNIHKNFSYHPCSKIHFSAIYP